MTILLALVSACSAPDGTVVRVAHANIAGWAIYAGSTAAGDDLAGVITREELDVIGVSEACESQVAAAIEALGGDRYMFAFKETAGAESPLPWTPPPESGCRYGNALIVRAELGLRDVEMIELPTADRAPGTEFDPEEDRWAVCGGIRAGRPVMVCSTHFSNLVVTPGVRVNQADALHAAVDGLLGEHEPVIVVGDFNARSRSGELGPFQSWEDAARSRGVVHVFTRGADGLRRGTASVGRADHDLLWADVRIPAEN